VCFDLAGADGGLFKGLFDRGSSDCVVGSDARLVDVTSYQTWFYTEPKFSFQERALPELIYENSVRISQKTGNRFRLHYKNQVRKIIFVVFFLLGDSAASNFMCRRFGTLCSIFTGGISLHHLRRC